MSTRVVRISLHDFNVISTIENYTVCIFEAAWISERKAAADRKSILEALTQLDDELPVLYHITVDGRDDAEDFVIDKLLSTTLPAIAILSCGGIVEHNERLKSNGVFDRDSFALNFRRVKANLPRLLKTISSYDSSPNTNSTSIPLESNFLYRIIPLLFDNLNDNERMKMDDESNSNTTLRGNKDSLRSLAHQSRKHPDALTLFLSGDKSSVGKSSTCLAILATLIRCGVPPSAIAYIKPVTQCEAGQPVTEYCTRAGISHCGIGPVVFYKGFTRAYLKGETPSADALLQLAVEAVSQISIGKRVVIVDGVGYPSVGSICNLSNAHIAQALGSPVLLIGKPGVGDAVDSFNINAKYFESFGVRVLGGIFNKLPLEGFYSLEACKEAVTSYFSQHGQQYYPYGFIPLLPPRVESGRMDVVENSVSDAATASVQSAAPPAIALIANSDSPDVEALVDAFLEHVDLGRLLYSVFKHTITSREMNLTRSNGFAPFVRSQHRGQAGYEQPTMAMLKISNDNRRTERPYIPDVISNHGYSHEMNGNTASRSVTSFNRKYEYDNPDENRSDRAPYHENERNYGRSTDTSRSSSVPTRAGHRAESGYSSSIFDEMHPVKRQRHDSGPQAALLVQTADTSFLNVPSQRTREEIEAAAYSQGAKKGG